MKNMNIFKTGLIAVGLLVLITSCSSDDSTSVDEEYPTINLAETYPETCTELQRGKTITAKITVDDNVELGSVSLDIHNDFDHHNHSTEIEECSLDPQKEPDNPFKYIISIPIPEGQDHYVIEKDIDIPADVDPGDYHFMIRVTDKAGWQTMKGLSIKIKE